MESRILKEMIAVIRTEQEHRAADLTDEDPNYAYDQWLFNDGSFINAFCLMLLVALRHQVERGLIRLAARAAHAGEEITCEQHKEQVKKLQNMGNNERRMEIENRLELSSCKKYKHMDVLRRLANSFKHDPSMEPNNELLKLLNLETGVPYDTLPNSDDLRKGLADLVGLEEDADYPDIAERFVNITYEFLEGVQNRTKLSPIKRSPASLNPKNFAR